MFPEVLANGAHGQGNRFEDFPSASFGGGLHQILLHDTSLFK